MYAYVTRIMKKRPSAFLKRESLFIRYKDNFVTAMRKATAKHIVCVWLQTCYYDITTIQGETNTTCVCIHPHL